MTAAGVLLARGGAGRRLAGPGVAAGAPRRWCCSARWPTPSTARSRVVTGRETRLGQVYDSVADRLTEAAWLPALWLLGAPGWLVAGCRRAVVAARVRPGPGDGRRHAEIGAVTVGERPTRVLVALFGLLVRRGGRA